AGCIAGALSFTEYRQGLEAAGFADIEITATHPVADGMHSAIVRAVKPAGTTEANGSSTADACCGDAARPAIAAESTSGCGCQG
ncbi:MAG: arsenite S-adenosylmethyltransferase, partial [Streptomyces sp.]|nr:arsenite S-adenosylmethyltransferase [Streptomyces sp.]